MKVVYLGTDFMDGSDKYKKLMHDVFGDIEAIPLYGVFTDEGILDMFAKVGNNVLYIKKGEKILISNFLVNDNYDISNIALGEDEYSLSYNSARVVRNGLIQEHLSFVNNGDDDDPYRGFVTYTQFDPEQDVECTLRYEHRNMMSEAERERIYPYHLKDADYISIDEQTKAKPFDHGFLGKRHKYFARMNLDCESYDYDLVAIKEFGLGEFIHHGSYSLLKEPDIVRYSRGIYLDRNDLFRCVWPFGYPYKREEILELIRSHSFKTGIPQDLLDIYNGDNQFVRFANGVMKEVKVLEEKGKNVGDAVLLQLKP